MAVLKDLECLIGKEAIKALQSGAYLYIWRSSSPYNWYICYAESPFNFIWHSGDRIGNSSERVTSLPLEFFEKVADIGGLIPIAMQGKYMLPEKTQYKLLERYKCQSS